MEWIQLYVIKKAHGIICSLAGLRRLACSKKSLTSLCRTLLEPALFYGLPVWGNTFSNTKRLFEATKWYAHSYIVLDVINRFHSYLTNSKILYRTSAVNSKIAPLVFKAIHIGLPLSFMLSDLVKPGKYELKSNRKTLIHQAFCRTVYLDQNSEIALVRHWNAMPVEVRENGNLMQFKRKPMAHLSRSG